jgi:anti-sigma regulatory factor (Ser/Thr protein kinase)
MESIRNGAAIPIEEETQVAAARRAAADLCRRLQLADATVARAELVAVELAGNILHHAQRGKLYLGPVPDGAGLMMVSVDSGPGMGDIQIAMRDGFSTGGTPGLGLGSVQRQTEGLDLYSRSEHGTVISTTLRDHSAVPAAKTAVLSIPLAGETVNGDSWAIYRQRERTIYLMVDGLGHGHYASQAAAAAIRVADAAIACEPDILLAAILQRMHQPMQATRGAAVLLVSSPVVPDGAETTLLCCGVGNVSAVLCAPDGTTKALVSHNGTVGHRMARVQEFTYSAVRGTLLVMHTDGISTRWKLSQYPGLQRHAPATIAGMIMRDAARERDDATVLVERLGGLENV